MRISDWSSDVCSSDLIPPFDERGNLPPGIHRGSWSELEGRLGGSPWRNALLLGLRDAIESLRQAGCNTAYLNRSEGRRVGKEGVSTCRSRWSPNHYKKKN